MTVQLAVGREAPLVCDGCHANADNGPPRHQNGCIRIGVHQHHTTLPIEDCVYYQEWCGDLVSEPGHAATGGEHRRTGT